MKNSFTVKNAEANFGELRQVCRSQESRHWKPACRPLISSLWSCNMTESPVVVAGALGECVHVAGVMNFLRLAENAGWQTVFLGPAVSVEQVLAAARAAERSAGRRLLSPDPGDRRTAVGRVRRGRRRPAPRQACASRSAARRRWPSAPAPSASSSRSSTAQSRLRMCWPICAASQRTATAGRLSADDHRAHRLEGALSR